MSKSVRLTRCVTKTKRNNYVFCSLQTQRAEPEQYNRTDQPDRRDAAARATAAAAAVGAGAPPPPPQRDRSAEHGHQRPVRPGPGRRRDIDQRHPVAERGQPDRRHVQRQLVRARRGRRRGRGGRVRAQADRAVGRRGGGCGRCRPVRNDRRRRPAVRQAGDGRARVHCGRDHRPGRPVAGRDPADERRHHTHIQEGRVRARHHQPQGNHLWFGQRHRHGQLPDAAADRRGGNKEGSRFLIIVRGRPLLPSSSICSGHFRAPHFIQLIT